MMLQNYTTIWIAAPRDRQWLHVHLNAIMKSMNLSIAADFEDTHICKGFARAIHSWQCEHGRHPLADTGSHSATMAEVFLW